MKTEKIIHTLFSLLLIVGILFVFGCQQTNELESETANGQVENGEFATGLRFWTAEGDATKVAFENPDYAAIKIGSEGRYEATVYQNIKNLTPGYYYLEARASSDGDQDACYLFAVSQAPGGTVCKTAVPRKAKDGEWKTVTVRGIEVKEDGELKIGVYARGNGQAALFNGFTLNREKNQSRCYPGLFGGAVSWLDWEEDSGALFYNENGKQEDALTILRDSGCNAVRLELYNNPGSYIDSYGSYFPAGYKDADAIFSLAKRANALGMKIFLSFMYSDYWGNSAIPADWLAKLDEYANDMEKASSLAKMLHDYTVSFLRRLKDAGIEPPYIALGNEIDAGILLPYGSSYGGERFLSVLTKFLNKGYEAVKEVFPDSQVVLHIGCNADDMHWSSKSGGGIWFFDLMEKHGVQYDVIGTSFYPYWAQTTDRNAVKKSLDLGDLKEWCEMMIDRYNKDILICESGYNWGTPGQLSNNGAYENIYPSTPSGQRDFMIDLINTVKSVKDGRCVGDLYWDPILVRQPGIGWALYDNGKARPNVVETTTFFDYEHKALPVLHAYRDNAETPYASQEGR